MTTSTTRETPVLIVGGGPVGLALAADLGWRGTECVLIEQTDGTINTPKMNEVNIRTMEHLFDLTVCEFLMQLGHNQNLRFWP